MQHNRPLTKHYWVLLSDHVEVAQGPRSGRPDGGSCGNSCSSPSFSLRGAFGVILILWAIAFARPWLPASLPALQKIDVN